METDSTKTSSTPTDLSRISKEDTVQQILARRFDQITTPISTRMAVEIGIPLVMVEKVTGRNAILEAIEFEVIKASTMVNIDNRLNIQIHQVPVIAEAIFDGFKVESIEDFKLAFKKGIAGFYGEIYRLDIAVLVRWIQLYLDEKYSVVEEIHQKEKKKNLTDVDYEKFHERLRTERAKQNDGRQAEIERRRAEATERLEKGETKSGSVEAMVERQIHSLWIKLNFNIDGTKKDQWTEKQAWIEKNTDLIKHTLTNS